MKTLSLKQGSEEWIAFRKGKISGTKFKKVLSDKKDTRFGLICELVADEYSTQVKDNFVSNEMSRGTDEEKFAAKAYEELFETELEVVDICQHDSYEWLIFSPDRFTNNRKKYIEIKCPDSATMVGYTLENKIPSEYKAQVLLSFIVNEREEECDLVIYDARFLEANHKITVINIKRSELKEDIDEAIIKLEKFRKEWLEAKAIYQNKIF
jgi:putative phage-type endonuclease